MSKTYSHMILLSGEQTAPNLLAARYYAPEKVYILHTDFWKSKLMAERLAMRLESMFPETREVAAFQPGKVTETVSELLDELPDLVVNITGGTKPMSIGALQAAQRAGKDVIYVRSQGGKTEIDTYTFSKDGHSRVLVTHQVMDAISLEDYLVSYFGTSYQVTGVRGKKGTLGRAFEEAIEQALQPPVVDEIHMGWKHESGAVDVDAVIRCNNQVGIMEIKTGSKARSAEGIKQLALAGGQRFFGTYARRFLVVNQDWTRLSNLKALAEALDITVLELPEYREPRPLRSEEIQTLKQAIYSRLSKPARYVQWEVVRQKVIEQCARMQYFLSTYDERKFQEQAGDWEAGDQMIDFLNKSIGETRDRILEDLAAWEPPAETSSLTDIIQSAIEMIDNGPHCKNWGDKKACERVTNALRSYIKAE
ncbi:MAG: DUF1887 family protein [Gammaproteobacteria bacterium]|nr:MAG: DUF1887 family protein [Gammaproteobacteria bacterium]